MIVVPAEEPEWLTICLWGCHLQESLSWLRILHNHSPFPTKDALQVRCYSASSSSHRMTQISNCSGSPNFPTVMMSPCCQGQDAMVEEKCRHRATETINMFLCSTSSTTKASPCAISGNIKDSCLEGGGYWQFCCPDCTFLLFEDRCSVSNSPVECLLFILDRGLRTSDGEYSSLLR